MGFVMDFFILGGGEAATCSIMPPIIEHNGGGNNDHFTPGTVTLTLAFSGSGLLSAQLCKHIGFLAHSLSSIAETIVFAYLGLFLFDDKVYNMMLDQVAIWTCVISRLAVVLFLGSIVNLAIRVQLEARTRRLVRGLLGYSTHSTETTTLIHTNRDGPFLDRKTQLILILAGIRGAVSFALVSNIPVYDVVTQRGTKYKGEIKAMTSTAIIFTLFVFGFLTYYFVDRRDAADEGTDNNPPGTGPKPSEKASLVVKNGNGTSDYGSLE